MQTAGARGQLLHSGIPGTDRHIHINLTGKTQEEECGTNLVSHFRLDLFPVVLDGNGLATVSTVVVKL